MKVIAARWLRRHFLPVLAMLAAGSAQAQECPLPNMRQAPAEVSLETSVAEPVIRNDRSRAEMTASVAASMGDAGKQGLTTANTTLELIPSFQYLPVGNNRFCLVLSGVKASWRITAMTVDVASEYRPGTCQYTEIIAHEQEHVRFNRDTFHEYVPRMEARLKTAARDIRPQIVDSGIQHGMSVMTERLKQAGGEIQAAYTAKSGALHAGIDTARNYAAVTRRCPSW